MRIDRLFNSSALNIDCESGCSNKKRSVIRSISTFKKNRHASSASLREAHSQAILEVDGDVRRDHLKHFASQEKGDIKLMELLSTSND